MVQLIKNVIIYIYILDSAIMCPTTRSVRPLAIPCPASMYYASGECETSIGGARAKGVPAGVEAVRRSKMRRAHPESEAVAMRPLG